MRHLISGLLLMGLLACGDATDNAKTATTAPIEKSADNKAAAANIDLSLYMTDLGPTKGEAIPYDLALKDQTGEVTDYASLSGDKGIALVFFRSADWCPYCMTQLIDLNAHADTFKAVGYNLVGLSYDAPEKLEKFHTSQKLKFDLLSDENSDVIDGFGLRNTDYAGHAYADGVPYPVVIIIDKDQMIQAKLATKTYQTRPPVEAILKAIKQL